MLKTLNIVNQNRWIYYVTGGFFQIRSNTSHHYMYTRNNRLNVQLNIDYRYIYFSCFYYQKRMKCTFGWCTSSSKQIITHYIKKTPYVLIMTKMLLAILNQHLHVKFMVAYIYIVFTKYFKTIVVYFDVMLFILLLKVLYQMAWNLPQILQNFSKIWKAQGGKTKSKFYSYRQSNLNIFRCPLRIL